jgi:hypothetical protein
MIKKAILSFILVGSMSAQAAAPAAHETKMPLPNMIAIATAHTLNNLGTVDGFTKWIAKRVPESEMVQFKANLPKMGLTPETAFPKVTAKANKVYFDKDVFFTVNKNSVVMNGKTFKKSDKTFDVLTKEIYDTLVKSKTAHYSIFIPEAQALTQQATWGLAGAGIGALVGYFAGPQLGVDSVSGAVGGAAIGGLGGLVLGQEDQSWVNGLFGSNNQAQVDISCGRGGSYRVCSNSGGTFYGDSSQCQVMPPQSAQQYGQLPNCQPDYIPRYRQHYADMGNNNYYPNRQGPPAGAVQFTQ